MTGIPRRLGLVTAIDVLILAALTTAVAAHGAGLTRIEHALGSAALRTTRQSSTLDAFWSADASVQQPDVFRFFLLVGVIFLLGSRRWWYAGWLASVLVVSTALAGVVKLPMARPRPNWSDPVTTAAGYSYPSGHATAAWVFATSAVLLGLSLVSATWWRRALVVLAVFSAAVVSLDRVFLGVHYPSDVVAGALLGFLLAVLPWLALSRIFPPP